MTSWLIRLADANGVSLQALCSDIWPKGQLLKYPIDWTMSDDLVDALAVKSHSSADEVKATLLETLGSHLFVDVRETKCRKPWVMPVASFTRDGGGQMFCAECLKEDQCHYRRSWRLSYVTRCEKHNRLLEDVCPSCRQAKKFMGGGRNPKFRSSLGLMTHCIHCGADFRKERKVRPHPVMERHPELMRHAMELQVRLQAAATTGIAELPSGEPTHSNLFFDGVQQLLKVLISEGGSSKFEPVLRAELGTTKQVLPQFRKGFHPQFEHLGIRDRNLLMGIAGWLLAEWPTRFVDVSRAAGVFSKILLQERGEALPFWYCDTIREHLTVRLPQWRDPNRPREEQISYRALAARKTSSRLAERENRIRFIQANPELVADLRGLAKAMIAAGLYSVNGDARGISKTLGKLVKAASEQNEWWRMAGAPVSA